MTTISAVISTRGSVAASALCLAATTKALISAYVATVGGGKAVLGRDDEDAIPAFVVTRGPVAASARCLAVTTKTPL